MGVGDESQGGFVPDDSRDLVLPLPVIVELLSCQSREGIAMKISRTIGVVAMLVAASAMLADGGQPTSSISHLEHKASDGRLRSPCDRLPGPWIRQCFLQLEANVRTTIRLENDSLAQSFVLFDSIVDRRCTVAFTSQPEFWQTYAVTDSCFALPMPPLPSGVYLVTVERPDTTYTERWVIMK